MKQFLTGIQDRQEQYKNEHEQLDRQLHGAARQRRTDAYRDARHAFRETFDDTILKDIKELATTLIDTFKKYDVILRWENHHKYLHFGPFVKPVEPFIVFAVETRKTSMHNRWTKCAYLTFESDINAGTIKLYRCNESRENIKQLKESQHPHGKQTQLTEFKLQEYDLQDVLPHINTFFDKELQEFVR